MDGTTPPAVLTIAGSDSSGGAGIQADLKTFMAFGCYGASVITALTAQNTKGVQGVHPTPPDFLEQQLNAVLEDIEVKAIKTGMLYDAEHTRRIARTLKAHFHSAGSPPMPPLVVDPVSVSTSGDTLLHPGALDVMVQELFPLATLVTPNKPETELLLSRIPDGGSTGSDSERATIATLEDMVAASERLLALGLKAVLVKGGHVPATFADLNRLRAARPEIVVVQESFLDERMEILQVNEADLGASPLVVDVLRESEGGVTLFVSPQIESTNTHGTGCTLAAAIASALSKGELVREAVRQATVYTYIGIETAFPVGKGYGPLNHMHALTRTMVPRPTPKNPHPLTRLLIQSSRQTWKDYVEHDFVKQLARGTLPKKCFLHFIKQDYLYLKYYARANGLLVAKSSTYSSMHSATQTILNIITEVSTHTSLAAQWGIPIAELDTTPEAPSTTAYGAYLLDVGLQGDSAKVIMALAACLLGYGEVGLWLKHEAARPNSWVVLEGNPYRRWIEDYSGKEYQAAVRLGIETIETLGVEDAPNARRFAEWCAIWERCTRLEKGFWDASLGLL